MFNPRAAVGNGSRRNLWLIHGICIPSGCNQLECSVIIAAKGTAGIEYAEKEITEKSPYEAFSVIFLAIATPPENTGSCRSYLRALS